MTRIEILRRFLFPLRRHFGWIGLAGNASRPELVALNVVLAQPWLPIVKLSTSFMTGCHGVLHLIGGMGGRTATVAPEA
jgi:hypothetical protein